MNKHGLPPQLFTADPDVWDDESRIQVDVGQTAFWQGRQFRISFEYNIASGQTQVIKFSSPVDFILQFQGISCDVGAAMFRAFRAGDGTPGGTFGTTIPVFRNNAMGVAPAPDQQVTVTTGGTFTPDSPPAGLESLASETIRLRAGQATGQRTSVSGSASDERGLFPADFYLLLENIAGSGEARGVFDLRWEERPDNLDDWLPNRYGRYDV